MTRKEKYEQYEKARAAEMCITVAEFRGLNRLAWQIERESPKHRAELRQERIARTRVHWFRLSVICAYTWHIGLHARVHWYCFGFALVNQSTNQVQNQRQKPSGTPPHPFMVSPIDCGVDSS